VPVITVISLQKSKNRVNIYLDGKFGFGIDLDNFVKLNLKVEQDLSEEEIETYLKTTFNFEDSEPNLAIVKGIKEEIAFSKKNIELLDKLKDFNHDDASVLDADELSDNNYPEDEELVGDVTIDPNLEIKESENTLPAKKKGSKKNTPKS